MLVCFPEVPNSFFKKQKPKLQCVTNHSNNRNRHISSETSLALDAIGFFFGIFLVFFFFMKKLKTHYGQHRKRCKEREPIVHCDTT